MQESLCESCGTAVGSRDNFCRACGAQLVSPDLPVVIEPNRSLLVRQEVPPALVKTAAALAVGTVLEMAGRAILSAMARRARSGAVAAARPRDRERAVTYTETVYVRRTRIRWE